MHVCLRMAAMTACPMKLAQEMGASAKAAATECGLLTDRLAVNSVLLVGLESAGCALSALLGALQTFYKSNVRTAPTRMSASTALARSAPMARSPTPRRLCARRARMGILERPANASAVLLVRWRTKTGRSVTGARPIALGWEIRVSSVHLGGSHEVIMLRATIVAGESTESTCGMCLAQCARLDTVRTRSKVPPDATCAPSTQSIRTALSASRALS